MDRGAWEAAVHEVAKSWTLLSDFTFTFHFHASEKEMATHSGVHALRIPGMGEPGGLPSMGSHRVGHDWSDLQYYSKYAFNDIWLEKSNILHSNCSKLHIKTMRQGEEDREGEIGREGDMMLSVSKTLEFPK